MSDSEDLAGGTRTETDAFTALPPGLLTLIVCPACRAKLEAARRPTASAALRCAGCGNIYPIVDGIPILLPGRANNGKSPRV